MEGAGAGRTVAWTVKSASMMAGRTGAKFTRGCGGGCRAGNDHHEEG